MIIDAHTHIFPPSIQHDRTPYLERDRGFAAIYSGPRAKIATVDDLLFSMDRAGVERSIACNFGWADLDLCRWTNDYLMEAVARYPDRITGFGMTAPAAGAAAWDEVRRCAAGGLRGIGELRPDDQGLDLTDPEHTEPFAAVLREMGMVLLTHASEPVGHTYAGKSTVTPDQLYLFLAQHPDLPVVLAHWGGGLPFYALMPEVQVALANVWVDTAASHLLYTPRVYRTVVDLIGIEKVLFASDFPLVTQSRARQLVEEAGLSEGELAAVLGGNAARLLGLSSPQV